MAASTPESRPTNTTSNSDTTTIPHSRGGIPSGRSKRVDVRFAIFLAEEYSALEAKLEQEAAGFVGTTSLEWHLGEWEKETKWHKIVPGKKPVYKAHAYKDNKGRPRRRVWKQPFPSGDTKTFDDLAVINEKYNSWREDRLKEAGQLSDTERLRLEVQRKACREQQAKELAEREAREKARAEAKRREEEAKAKLIAQERAQKIAEFPNLPLATRHRYLASHGLEGRVWNDVRLDGRNLAIAVRDVETLEIVGIQYIWPDGQKRFLTGTLKKNSAIFVTGLPPVNAKRCVLGEGWASVAACAQALADETPEIYFVAALDAGNLALVYPLLKTRCPQSSITLASDDDACPINKKGEPKENTGQLKARALVQEHGCAVAVPSIPGVVNEDVDFNDVLRQCGPEAVQQQLLGVMVPHVAKGLELAHAYNCTVEICPGRNIALQNLKPGISLLDGGMGTGKTNAVKNALWELEPESALIVTPLVALTGDASTRMGVKDYNAIRHGSEGLYSHAAYCLNSLHRLGRAQMRPFKFLFLDEPRKMLGRLKSREAFTNKRQCLAVLEYLVKNAKYLVLADAHMDRVVMRWLRRLRPHDPPRMLLGSYQPGHDKTVYTYKDCGDVRSRCRDLLAGGKKVYYALNSITRANDVTSWIKGLQEELPGLRVLLVCSDTAATPEVRAWQADPTAESPKYDLIVTSPSVTTGVSIEGGHINAVCGEFTHLVGTPYDAAQALMRARGVTEYHLWVSPVRQNRVTDREAIRRTFWERPGVDADLTNGYDNAGQLTAVDNYIDTWLDTETADRAAVNRYADVLCGLLEDDGCTLLSGVPAEDAKAIEKSSNEAAAALRVDNLAQAERLDDDQAAELRARRTKTSDQQDALELYDLQTFYRVGDDAPEEELRALIKADKRGRRQHEIRRLELVRKPEAELPAMMEAECVRREGLVPDMTHHEDRHIAYSTTLQAAYIDPRTLAASGETYDAEALRETWIAPLEAKWQDYRETVPSWPELQDAKAKPTWALGLVLRALGLGQERTGKNAKGIYRVRVKPLEVQREWIMRRAELPEKKGDRETLKDKDFFSVAVPSTVTGATA